MKKLRQHIRASRKRQGFTLLELLVAMVILSMILVSLSQVFQQSTAAWDTGFMRSEMFMAGRALSDFVVNEASMALCDSTTFTLVSGSTAEFHTLEGTNSLAKITYYMTGQSLRRRAEFFDGVTPTQDTYLFRDLYDAPAGTRRLRVQDFSLTFEGSDPVYPESAVVSLTLRAEDKQRRNQSGAGEYEQVFRARAMLMNRQRYMYEN